MGKSRFTNEEILAILAEHRDGGASIALLCRKYGVSGATLYRWRATMAGEARGSSDKLRSLKEENRKLKRLLIEILLTSATLCDMLEKPADDDTRNHS